MADWPVYFNDNLLLGNPEKGVGIVTLWTLKDVVASKVPLDDYTILSQLYSRQEGISALVRNCLLNKNIRHIVVTGTDINQSGQALVNLFKKGIDDEGNINGVPFAKLDKEIPCDAVERFRSNVNIHDLRDVRDFSEVAQYVSQLSSDGPYGEPESFPDPEISLPERFPTDYSGFKVRGNFVGEVWLSVLDTIMRFGVVKKSQYSEDQREVLNIVAVIEHEDGNSPKWYEFFPFTRQDLEDYYPQVLSDRRFDNVEYTYGQRLFNFKNLNQIQGIIDKLKDSSYTRRAVAVTWDILHDATNSNAPCLDLLQCLVEDDKLFMTVYFRSHDMFDAWPRNIFALRRLQSFISEGAGIALGSLSVVSCSAHIYERNWQAAKELLDKHSFPLRFEGDPRGNLIIRLQDGKIQVRHLSPEGSPLAIYEGTKAAILYRELCSGHVVSELSHAFDIGCELQKAEIALIKNIPYIQDKALEFS
ncbi:thymidylate synthase [Candidatus Woesearchaeota archaeon]|nr:thymidylate synthase [Candidatus Woesearchaeota archaeon]